MNILFLRGFNNYFNRTIKLYSDLSDYEENSISYMDFSNINFNPNDGVATELIIGNASQKESNIPLDWENTGTPDYCVCYWAAQGQSPSIISRWFILESERTRSGQYRLALKRDVVAENIKKIKTAPCFIEKGFPKNYTNPLLYNKENMTYNQIKKDEIRLYDETRVPWIIGYMSSKIDVPENNITKTLGRTVTYSANLTGSNITWSSGVIGADVTEMMLMIMDTNSPTSTVFAQYSNHRRLGTGIFTPFEAEYDASTGDVTYSYDITSANIPTGSTKYLYIQLRLNDPISISGTIKNYIDNYISAVDLPWTFDPNATEVIGLNNYRVNTKITQCTSTSNIIVSGAIVATRTYYSLYDFTNNLSYNNTSVSIDKSIRSPGPINLTPQEANNYSTLYGTPTGSLYNIYNYLDPFFRTVKLSSVASIQTEVSNIFNRTININLPNIYSAYNNKIVKYNNKYYLLNISPVNNIPLLLKYKALASTDVRENTTTGIYAIIGSGTIYTDIKNKLSSLATDYNTNYSNMGITLNYHEVSGNDMFTIESDMNRYAITATEISNDQSFFTTISADTVRNHLIDAPYDMFAIPYGEVTVKTGTSTYFDTNKNLALALANEIPRQLGSQLYDIQILPYCPLQNIIYTTGGIDIRSLTENVDYKKVSLVDSQHPSGISSQIVLWATRASGTIDLTYQIQLPQLNEDDIINHKLINETYLYRLVSPNYSGQFEFNLSKMFTNTVSFNVDYTYKPFNPYIHINPVFSGLYGNDWDDARGLICGGDFSLAVVNDAWTQYQINNKNYNQIFDRQIQNMDVNNRIAKEQAMWQVGAGTVQGMASGAVSGALVGGGIGAAVGAVVGGTLSAAGGAMDMRWLKQQQEENRDYAIDMYGYNLGNIQALPYSLSKVSAFTYNNRFVPFLEIYTATDIEQDVLFNKIMADGMTIMAISTINDYYRSDLERSFIRGQMIRIENLNDDFHIADAIYNEIYKGVYLTPTLKEV